MNTPDLRAAIVALLPDLRGYARFVTRDRTEADDLVQEALVRALGALHQFRPGTNLRAWLFVILRNAFFEQAPRRRTERALLERRVPAEEPAPPAQETRSELADLEGQIYILPPLLRESLVLVAAQGMSYEQAAEICNVPVGTIKARVSRARASLARSMQRVTTQSEE